MKKPPGRKGGMMKQSYRWVILIIGFIIMLAAGLVFSFSIFVEPIEAELGFLRSETSLIFPISLSVSILGQIVAGVFAKKNHIRYNFLATALLCGLGFFLAGCVWSIGMLYLSYGILVGLAIGMMYNGVLSTVVLHFNDRADFAAGVLLFGFGLGSMALGTISAALIENVGWRSTFHIFAAVFSGLSILGAFTIVRPQAYETKQSNYNGKQVPPQLMVRNKKYLLTFIWITVLVSSYLVISGHAALCVSDIGATPYLAAFSIGLVSIANVAARILVSAIYKKLGGVIMQYILTLIGIVSSILCLTAYMGSMMTVMLMGYTMLGFLNGGCTIVINAYVMNEYGNENFALNMAITNIHLAIASLLGPAVAGYLKTAFGSYIPAFLVMIAFSLLALGLLKINRNCSGGSIILTNKAGQEAGQEAKGHHLD